MVIEDITTDDLFNWVEDKARKNEIFYYEFQYGVEMYYTVVCERIPLRNVIDRNGNWVVSPHSGFCRGNLILKGEFVESAKMVGSGTMVGCIIQMGKQQLFLPLDHTLNFIMQAIVGESLSGWGIRDNE